MGADRELEETLHDPMAEHVPLPICRTFYPHGFPVEIATNSAAVVDAARESWGSYPWEFDRPPIRIRVMVADVATEPAPEPTYRSQRGLMLIVSGRENYAACDMRSRFGWCHISANMLADRGWFRWFFLEAMVYFLLVQEDVVAVHAACVAREGRGILLCGESGAGKSTLAFACAQAGWTYVSDDGTLLVQGSRDREALGKPYQFRFRPEAVELFPQIAGLAACIKPNGKPTVEVLLSALPQIATALRCRIERVVFLKRNGDAATVKAISARDAMDRLMRELPAYSDDVYQRHRDTVATLLSAPACELRYQTFAQAIPLLAALIDQS